MRASHTGVVRRGGHAAPLYLSHTHTAPLPLYIHTRHFVHHYTAVTTSVHGGCDLQSTVLINEPTTCASLKTLVLNVSWPGVRLPKPLNKLMFFYRHVFCPPKPCQFDRHRFTLVFGREGVGEVLIYLSTDCVFPGPPRAHPPRQQRRIRRAQQPQRRTDGSSSGRPQPPPPGAVAEASTRHASLPAPRLRGPTARLALGRQTRSGRRTACLRRSKLARGGDVAKRTCMSLFMSVWVSIRVHTYV